MEGPDLSAGPPSLAVASVYEGRRGHRFTPSIVPEQRKGAVNLKPAPNASAPQVETGRSSRLHQKEVTPSFYRVQEGRSPLGPRSGRVRYS
jgi:hypothetical protein